MLSAVWAGDTSQPRPSFIGATAWQIDAANFGGWSGLELSGDGASFTALTDRGHIAQGALHRIEGKISKVTAGTITALSGPRGLPLAAHRRDSEGLALTDEGAMFVSLEGVSRVLSYQNPASASHRLPRHPDFKTMVENGSLEALAVDRRGWLYTLPERSGRTTAPFPLYRFNGQTWDQPFAISRSGGFLVVGADFGPDGHLYVLERAFSGVAFRSRLRRFDLANFDPAGEVLLTTRGGAHGNLEGLSIWQDSTGRTRATMISDNNFRKILRTEFVEYAF